MQVLKLAPWVSSQGLTTMSKQEAEDQVPTFGPMEPAEKLPSSESASGDVGDGTGARSPGNLRGSNTAGASVSSSSASAPTSAASSAEAAS